MSSGTDTAAVAVVEVAVVVDVAVDGGGVAVVVDVAVTEVLVHAARTRLRAIRMRIMAQS